MRCTFIFMAIINSEVPFHELFFFAQFSNILSYKMIRFSFVIFYYNKNYQLTIMEFISSK